MRDRFSEAMEEMQEKSAFTCVSCGHHEITQVHEQMAMRTGKMLHDRFSDAVAELEEKSAFICESCTKH
jgi:rubrerythrin